ncbi:MAG TPA: F0F1 ATP synthase subunit A [Caulifigura sp.]|jgi:F-type H+-transporting ATPase subunit a|nr:F0F1 ATP synthase subunit A [Caulifigura sp.]
MADPVLHIKDSYFFEIPKKFWPVEYKTRTDVPEFLRIAHPDASLAEFNDALSGKILIPQPFGKLKNLYEPASGFLFSKFMILEVVAAVLLYFVFKKFAERLRSDAPPRGRFDNALESIVLFIRNDVARKAIHHHPDHYVPILATLFFFILTLNLFGMLPWLGSPTAAFATTLALAFVTWLVGFVAGTKELGVAGFWTNMIPAIDMPWWLSPLKWVIQIMLLGIEVLGMVIKHAVLGIRLLANMVAGHLVLLAILGMAVAAGSYWSVGSLLPTAGATLLSILELGVAFLQAFVFTFLSALFINAASASHSH